MERCSYRVGVASNAEADRHTKVPFGEGFVVVVGEGAFTGETVLAQDALERRIETAILTVDAGTACSIYTILSLFEENSMVEHSMVEHSMDENSMVELPVRAGNDAIETVTELPLPPHSSSHDSGTPPGDRRRH